jgi:lipopolysaccharide/colanic/teichoic acid biosynthesis glycosyltransferase
MSTQPVNSSSFQTQPSLQIAQTLPKSGVVRPTMNRPRQFVSPEADISRGHLVAPGLAWYLPLKRCCDLLLAIVILVLVVPIVLLSALLVKLTSRGPAFYRQVRMGLDGRPFTLIKLRTMKHDAEAQSGPVWATDHDVRVTPIGKLLRQSHIDEFPQLLNVIRGDMSLVGPRPERPEFVARLDWEVPHYRERLGVRPGITGLAQLRLHADTGLETVRRKLVYDIYYVRNVNPILDAKLLVMTAWRLCEELVRFAWHVLTLPSHEEVERGLYRLVGIEGDGSATEDAGLKAVSVESIGIDRRVEIMELDSTGVQGASG